MTQIGSSQETPGGRFRFLGVFAKWLKRATTLRRAPAKEPVRRRLGPPRQGLSMESLEQRTTISDALLGFVWPTLLGASAFDPRPKMAVSSEDSGQKLLVHSECVREAAESAQEPGLPLATRNELTLSPLAAEFTRTVSAVGRNDAADPFALTPPALSRTSTIRSRADAAAVRTAPDVGGRTTAEHARVAGEQTPLPPTAVEAGMSQLDHSTADNLVICAGIRNEEPGEGGVQSSGWQVSWQAGGYDINGQFMGGTELMHLTGYQGKLFAATSAFRSLLLGDPRVGGQILRLDSPEGEWQVEKHFDELISKSQMRHERVESLKVVTFTTDGMGQPLKEPVSMLLASPTDRTGVLAVYSRDDASETWTEMVLGQSDRPTQTRSFGFHQDQVTGVDRVFAGTNAGIYSGVYDPSVPGNIRWDKTPEIYHESRVMAFAEANGALHAVMKPEMYVRIDGPEPYWVLVVEYPLPPPIREGLRGLTTIPALVGGGEVILASLEANPGYLVRILPNFGYNYLIELDLVAFLTNQWGGIGYESAAAAYNNMLPVVDPYTGETVHLIGLMTYPPVGMARTSSWYLIRRPNATYELHEIPALPHPIMANPVLFANRTIVVSPFKEDAGQYFYFGGYDTLFLPARNTAWIYRASLETVLGK